MTRIRIASLALALATLAPAAGAGEIDDLTLRLDDSFEATVTRDGRDRTSRVTIDRHGPQLTLTVRPANGVELLRIGWRDGFAYGKLAGADTGLYAVDNESFDCRAWADEGWQRRLEQIANVAVDRLASVSGASEPPASEDVEAVSTAVLIHDLLAAACSPTGVSATGPEPGDVPAANACYHDNRDSYADCKSCCEREDGLMNAACGFAAAYVCSHLGSWWCGGGIGGSCSGIVDMHTSDCVARNCSGLPGDNSCPTPKPPCIGFCRHFCGIGWDSACGECPGPGDEYYQTACCA